MRVKIRGSHDRSSTYGGIPIKLSILIPVYNGEAYLLKTLLFIDALHLDTGLEVVVVDDGSTSPIEQTVRTFERRNTQVSLKYVRIPRDQTSCRAKTRNVGAQASSGEWITFLDNGTVIPPTFVTGLRQLLAHESIGAVFHRILGAFVNPDVHPMECISNLTPDTLPEIADSLNNQLLWRDPRQSIGESVYHLSDLPAPWTLGWSGALTVNRGLFNQVGGFDETFSGWGGEDIDLAYRLHSVGCIFVYSSDLYALDLPHPPSDDYATKMENNLRNLNRIHRKNYSFETEFLGCYPTMYLNQLIGRFENLVYESVLPAYSEELFYYLQQKYVQDAQPSVCIGTYDERLIRRLQCSHVFVQKQPSGLPLTKNFPNITFEYRLGRDTPYPDKYFSSIILTDMYRMLGVDILSQIVSELIRISKTVVFIFTEQFESVVRGVDGWPWHTDSVIRNILGTTTASQVKRIEFDDQYSLFVVE